MGKLRHGRNVAVQVCLAILTESHRPAYTANIYFLLALEARIPDRSYLSEIVLLGFRVTGTWMQEDRHKDILVEQEATALVTP